MAENLRSSASKELVLSTLYPCVLVKWKVAAKQKVSKGSILAVYKMINRNFTADSDLIVLPKLKSGMGGLVKELLVAEGDQVKPGQAVMLLDACEHKTVMKDMCAECGDDLRREPGIPGNWKEPVSASVALVHNIPELRVSQKEAEILGKKDKETLLKSGKLVLIVDLDQTLIHTTTENVPEDMKDVYHFQLYGQDCWYHTKFRPGWKTFLKDMKKHYELHIFTMGSRMYAYTIAKMLDPTGELFGNRIRSRDESFDMFSKYRDLSTLFPCDDSMVCIIDDREDIWDCAPNLVTVKPYRFFADTDDINAPAGFDQTFTHQSAIPVHENLCSNAGQNNDGAVTKKNWKYALAEVVDTEKEEKTSESSCEGCLKDADGGGRDEKIDVALEMPTKPVNGQWTRCGEKGEVPSSLADKNCEQPCEMHGGQETSEKSGELKEDEQMSRTIEENVNNEKKDVRQPEGSCGKGGRGEQVEDGGLNNDDDDYLLYLKDILIRIHQRFYEILSRYRKAKNDDDDESCVLDASPDLRHIVPELRENVLKGTNLVFTGLIPTNCPPEECQTWRIAKQFGANVTRELVTRKNAAAADKSHVTTHVIAARPGTEKVHQASRLPDVKLVNPNWLWTCAERWEWVEELLFPVGDPEEYKNRWKETPVSSRRAATGCFLESEASFSACAPTDYPRRGGADEFQETLNPLLSFSSGEVEAMDKEVEDLMRSSDGEEDVEEDVEEDNVEDDVCQEILGSCSSSTENGRNSSSSDGSVRSWTEFAVGEGGVVTTKGKVVNFSTIKQTTKRRLHDVNEDGQSAKKKAKNDSVEVDFDDNNSSSSSSSSSSGESSEEDGDDNDMAAMLEAAIYDT